MADKGAFALTLAQAKTLLAVIPFSTPGFVTNAGAGAAGNVAFAEQLTSPIAWAPGAPTIYGLLVVRNAYTPVSGESFTVILGMA